MVPFFIIGDTMNKHPYPFDLDVDAYINDIFAHLGTGIYKMMEIDKRIADIINNDMTEPHQALYFKTITDHYIRTMMRLLMYTHCAKSNWAQLVDAQASIERKSIVDKLDSQYKDDPNYAQCRDYILDIFKDNDIDIS